MNFELFRETKKVLQEDGTEKLYLNFFLKSQDGISIPIEIKRYVKDGKITNKSDYFVALKCSKVINNGESIKQK